MRIERWSGSTDSSQRLTRGDDVWDEPDHADPIVDPRSLPVGLDANALDRDDKRAVVIDRFLTLVEAARLALFIGEAVRAEWRDAAAKGHSSPLPLDMCRAPTRKTLTPAEHIARIRVRSIVCGNARVGKHEADALHLSEAAEAGCGYFITYDSRILRKRAVLEAAAVPGLRIVTLEEYLDVVMARN